MLQLKETGKITEIRQAICKVSGLSTCLNGQQIYFPDDAPGMVVGFTEEEASVLLLKANQSLRAGAPVYGLREVFDIPVGDAFLGRIVNPLGEPLDGKGPIKTTTRRSIFCDAPSVLDRRPVVDPIETGVKILDNMIPIGRGQRQLILGDRMTGKTTILTDTILGQKGRGLICIYCLIGKSESALNKVLQLLEEQGALKYSIVVAATAAMPAGQQYLAPYSACSIGEHFMNKGEHVLVGFDDFTRHSWIYRQISLLLERSPGREAYPGDIFYLHSQMIERAANLLEEKGGGSMTFLPIIETLQGDVTSYIPTNLISMTDGQVYLSTTLFSEGFKPAIDLGLSISRIGSKVQWPAIKKLSGSLRLEYIQYRELEKLARVKSGGAEDVEAKLKRGRILTEIIKQDKNRPAPLEEQVVLFYFFRQGKMDSLSIDQARIFRNHLGRWLKEAKPDFSEKLSRERSLTPEVQKELDELVQIAADQKWFERTEDS